MGRIIAITPLSNVATISSGQQLNRSTLQSTGRYPVYNGGTTTSGYTDKFNTPADQIIISQGGESAGFVNYITTPFWAGAHCYVIQPQTRSVDKRYLYFYLKSMQSYLQGSRTGSSIPGLSKSRLSSFPVQIPSIAEQQTISNVLTSIEDAISLNNSSIKTCSEIIQLVYDYWFVQFDFPDEDGRPYKSSGGKMVYSEQLGQEIPEGWHVSDLLSTSLATLIKPGINKFTGTKSYLATGDVISDEIKDNPSTVTYDKRETRANMQPKPNSIWFAKMKDSIKHIAVTDKSDDLLNDHIFSTGFCGFQAHDNCLGYLFAFIRQPQFEDIKNSLAHGATQKAIGNKDLASIAIIEPTNDVLSKFESVARPILYLMNHCRQESKQLASLRDWLLPMLINGQVEIKNGQ